ncbi:hypothetical protein Thiowin_02471 [Thiorhodovibrio winogradskyi]|uniref:Uncharacterized protein n=1 Tax=Thiorhodovibrio winogradskyi TaxID=77007 RepID=A0ABZ0SCY9_9GAMM|nr:hypothetical protein [Thiorhodovibrio winogradskyi]
MSPSPRPSTTAVPLTRLFGGIGARLLLLAGIPTLLLLLLAGFTLNTQHQQAVELGRIAFAT